MHPLIILPKTDQETSTELQYARQQFLMQLPAGADLVALDAMGPQCIRSAVLDRATELQLAPDHPVVVCRSAYLHLSPDALGQLANALRTGASSAYAVAGGTAPAELPPDYMTLRGMERYVARICRMPNRPVAPTDPLPLLFLTTVRALQDDAWQGHAVWVFGAYLHDFSNYHQGDRKEVIPFIAPGTRRILDVGGGEGRFLESLQSSLHCETHLSEFSATACASARSRVDRVWEGDFFTLQPDCRFDCITFLDVLEHTPWPAQWLSNAIRMLEPKGCIVASIPNVGHWSVVADLLEGRWDYATAGIHCITHLRFYTQRGVQQLMKEAGLQVERLEPVMLPAPAWFDVSGFSGSLTVDKASLDTFSFLITARPMG